MQLKKFQGGVKRKKNIVRECASRPQKSEEGGAPVLENFFMGPDRRPHKEARVRGKREERLPLTVNGGGR